MPDIIVKDFSIEPFKSLRTTPWEPSFDWVSPVGVASRRINQWHENGEEHYDQTWKAINDLTMIGEWTGLAITESIIKRTHAEIFPGEWWTGKWRTGRVTVGPHRPPHPRELHKLMYELMDEVKYSQGTHTSLDSRTIQGLVNWYYAFETIHPFHDGNGRVGGAIVAAYSHLIEPDKGYLAANQ